jgi:hypothetical protein
MGNKLVGRHGLHVYPLQPAEMILDPQSFFKHVANASFELTFEINSPEIVGGCGDGDGLARMTRFASPSLLSDESRVA